MLQTVPDDVLFRVSAFSVDDLDHGLGSRHVKASSQIVIYLSEGYLARANTVRECVCAVALRKPIVTIYEIEHGDCYDDAVKLRDAIEAALRHLREWKIDSDLRTLGVRAPSAQEVYDALTANTVVWARNSEFCHVTLRACIEPLLACEPSERHFTVVVKKAFRRLKRSASSRGTKLYESSIRRGVFGRYYFSAETLQKLAMAHHPDASESDRLTTFTRSGVSFTWTPLPSADHYDLYVSPSNHGAMQLTKELTDLLAPLRVCKLKVTSKIADLARCKHMLLYLNRHTWTSGDLSRTLSLEVSRAMRNDVHLLLAHETEPSKMAPAGSATHGGIRFEALISCVDGATPEHLLRRRIYNEIAVPLKGGRYRTTSLLLLAEAVCSRRNTSHWLSPRATHALLRAIGRGAAQGIEAVNEKWESAVLHAVGQNDSPLSPVVVQFETASSSSTAVPGGEGGPFCDAVETNDVDEEEV